MCRLGFIFWQPECEQTCIGRWKMQWKQLSLSWRHVLLHYSLMPLWGPLRPASSTGTGHLYCVDHSSAHHLVYCPEVTVQLHNDKAHTLLILPRTHGWRCSQHQQLLQAMTYTHPCDNNKSAAVKETIGHSIHQYIHANMMCAMYLASLLQSLTLPTVR